MAHYVTRQEVRVELGLDPDDVAALSDAAADRLIRLAESVIEQALGPYPTDVTLGLKIVEADVDAWRYERLKGAVLSLAARIHTQPSLLSPRYQSVSGPSFSYSGPIGPVLGDEISAQLNGTGLVIRGARARP